MLTATVLASALLASSALAAPALDSLYTQDNTQLRFAADTKQQVLKNGADLLDDAGGLVTGIVDSMDSILGDIVSETEKKLETLGNRFRGLTYDSNDCKPPLTPGVRCPLTD
jgi:hypothetical protein